MQNLKRTANNYAYFSDFTGFDTFDFILYNHSYKEKSTLLSANRRIKFSYLTSMWDFFFSSTIIK